MLCCAVLCCAVLCCAVLCSHAVQEHSKLVDSCLTSPLYTELMFCLEPVHHTILLVTHLTLPDLHARRVTHPAVPVCTGELKVEQSRICYGGVAPKCLMATNTQAALEGQPWTQATLDAALLAVAKDVNITPDAPGAILPALLLHSASYSVLVQHSFCLLCQLRPAALHCHICLKSSLYSFVRHRPTYCGAEQLETLLPVSHHKA